MVNKPLKCLKKGNSAQFTQNHRQLRVPLVFYVDLEAYLKQIPSDQVTSYRALSPVSATGTKKMGVNQKLDALNF